MFDDFDTQICCEEFYDDADYWEAMMNEESEEDNMGAGDTTLF